MVKLILRPMPPLYFICQSCYALVTYGIEDTFQGDDHHGKIKCPGCGTWNKVNLLKDYDGVIKESKT